MSDPIVLSAEARAIFEGLHKRNDVVVRMKTDRSGFKEDALDDLDRKAPGHFRTDRKILTLNLDELVSKDKEMPVHLASVEDFRKFPILTGVAAHECGHARWSLWGTEEGEPFPETIPNPDHDPENPESGPAEFPVKQDGALMNMAMLLEEPRIERLGAAVYTKTWRTGMSISAGHLILENVGKMDSEGQNPLDSAVGMAILIGGRQAAGTLGTNTESRRAVRKVLESAEAIIEEALPDVKDPYHTIMGIISREVFSNEHTDTLPHLESARQILKIVHPENADDPDNGPGAGGGDDGEGEGEGEEGSEGGGTSDAMSKLKAAMGEAFDQFVDEQLAEEKYVETANPESDKGGGFGSVMFQDPRAPKVSHKEEPNALDKALYHDAREWMLQQIQPTITEFEVNQWLPVGGARLDVRRHFRDNMAGHKGPQRSDWTRVSETVKPAPPVKVAIMLDGSGSMHSQARPSASIAWAVSNAAADLPESRTVSVVYGDAAAVTQKPGHAPAKNLSVFNTDGGTEDFIGAAEMVNELLWLDTPMEEGERTNVLIIIVSDLQYGGSKPAHNGMPAERQYEGFNRIVREWNSKGFNIVVTGADGRYNRIANELESAGVLSLVSRPDLFK